MAWLYVPGMEVLSWELNESFKEQEPFVMWRGKPLPFNTLSKKWKKESWLMRLSGLMSKPSTVQSGVEKWISYLEDSHVNPIQLLETKWEKQILATSGKILSESLGKCDQDSYSLKMFQTSLKCDLIPLSLTSINWGIMLHGVLWQLPTLVPPTEEGDGFAWRCFTTPTVMDSAGITKIRKVAKESLEKGNWRGIDLRTSAIMIPKANAARTHHQMEIWPTPTTRDYAHASEGQVAAMLKKVEEEKITLKEAEAMLNLPSLKNHRTFKRMFLTPTTQGNAQVAGQYTKKTGTTLAGFVKVFPTGFPINGEEVSTQSGKLNPQWVAWLMGLPIGWINSEYWETE